MWRTIGTVAAVITVVLFIWQNFEMRDQNALMRKQNQHLQEQNKVILDDSTRARRAQLIATIYDETDCGEEQCPPKAHIRSRTEAVLALVELDRGLGRERPLLAGVNLQEAELFFWDDLQNVNLIDVDLSGATIGASLHGAKLDGSNLEGAYFWGAAPEVPTGSLEPFLRDVDLKGVNLRGAHLDWINMRGATGLTKEQLAEAIIGEHTVLPDYLKEHRDELLESSKRNIEELERRRSQPATTDQPEK